MGSNPVGVTMHGNGYIVNQRSTIYPLIFYICNMQAATYFSFRRNLALYLFSKYSVFLSYMQDIIPIF